MRKKSALGFANAREFATVHAAWSLNVTSIAVCIALQDCCIILHFHCPIRTKCSQQIYLPDEPIKSKAVLWPTVHFIPSFSFVGKSGKRKMQMGANTQEIPKPVPQFQTLVVTQSIHVKS